MGERLTAEREAEARQEIAFWSVPDRDTTPRGGDCEELAIHGGRILAELDALRADLARVTGERDAMQDARAQTMGANEAALSAAEKERDGERAKANVECEKRLGAMRDERNKAREERDALASALAEVRSLIRDDHDEACSRRHGEQYRCRCDYDDRQRALSVLSADLAAQRDARVRAEALTEAASTCDRLQHARVPVTADEMAARLRSLADEAGRGGR